MQHVLKDNIGICYTRPLSPSYQFSTLVSNTLIDQCFVGNKSVGAGATYIAPLYLYKHEKRKNILQSMLVLEPEAIYGESNNRTPNIAPIIFEKLIKLYGKVVSPEDILHYVYAILYSNIYREKYAEFLKIDFPRIPFAKDGAAFFRMVAMGATLTQLHLEPEKTLSSRIVRFQGVGNGIIEKLSYDAEKQIVHINKDKHFEGITPEMWNYQIGGYQVLERFLKYRKGQKMESNELYCHIAKSIAETIDLQKKIDAEFIELEKDIILF
jgi:predicted helicase